jgi:glycerophosphoryl diester phosphodiesterase
VNPKKHPISQMTKHIDLQGHRGARGLWPENSLYGFIKTTELGVDVIELDVVMTGDGEILVSHDPFFNPEICLNPKGEELKNEQEYSFFKLDYTTLSRYDCGSKFNPKFPEQEKKNTSKPLLKDVLKSILEINSKMKFSIEIKSKKEWQGIYQPNSIAEYADAVANELKNIPFQQYSIQSFDTSILYSLAKRHAKINLTYLVEKTKLDEDSAKKLDIPLFAISPDYETLTKNLVKVYQKQGLKVIPWTVNEIEDMQRMVEWEVDAVITDYPNRWKEMLETKKA